MTTLSEGPTVSPHCLLGLRAWPATLHHVPLSLTAVIWIAVPTKGPSAEGLVASPWHYWEVVEPLELEPSGRKPSHWGCILERAMATLSLVCLMTSTG